MKAEAETPEARWNPPTRGQPPYPGSTPCTQGQPSYPGSIPPTRGQSPLPGSAPSHPAPGAPAPSAQTRDGPQTYRRSLAMPSPRRRGLGPGRGPTARNRGAPQPHCLRHALARSCHSFPAVFGAERSSLAMPSPAGVVPQSAFPGVTAEGTGTRAHSSSLRGGFLPPYGPVPLLKSLFTLPSVIASRPHCVHRRGN